MLPRVGEVPFDSDYKLMATSHEMESDGRRVIRCFVKVCFLGPVVYVALVELGKLVDRHVGRRELAPAPAET